MADYTHIQPETCDDVAVITFPLGRFDGNAVRELFEFSNQLPSTQPKLLIDTTGVAMVPSGGMGMLLTIRKRFLSVGGQLHVALPGANVRQSFKVANMHRMLALFDSVKDARAAFKP
ncbi:MAG: STAS domain-containing protein [Planctomycetota bacterium]